MRPQHEIKERLRAIGAQKRPTRRVTLRRLLEFCHVGPRWESRHLSSEEQRRLDHALDLLDTGWLWGRGNSGHGCWIRQPLQRRMLNEKGTTPQLFVDWSSNTSHLKWR